MRQKIKESVKFPSISHDGISSAIIEELSLMFWFHLADKRDQITSTGVAYWKVIISILTTLNPSAFHGLGLSN